MQNIHPGPKSAFLLKNLSRGLLWFIFLIAGYLFLKNYINLDFEKWLEPVFANNVLIFTVYVLSEFIFGIIPPELFMLWALRTENAIDYSMYVLLFAIISYIAGFAGFLFGDYLNKTILFRFIRRKYLGKYQSLLQKYGVFLILVAALTPLPYSAISMLVGSFHYPVKKYLYWALSRFIRYAVYAAIIWEANII